MPQNNTNNKPQRIEKSENSISDKDIHILKLKIELLTKERDLLLAKATSMIKSKMTKEIDEIDSMIDSLKLIEKETSKFNSRSNPPTFFSSCNIL